MRKLLILLLLAIPCHAATAFVQLASCVSQASVSTGCTIIFGSNMTAGNSVTVHLQTAANNFTVMPPPIITGAICWPLRQLDGNQSQSPSAANTAYLSDWICPNIPGGTATVGITTATFGSGVVFTAFAIEWSGLGTWPTFDQAPSTWPTFGSGGAFTSGTNSTMSVSSTTTAGALVILFGGQQVVGAGTNCTSATFTQPAGGVVANTNGLTCIQYNLSSAGGTTTGSQATGASQPWGYHLISILPGSTQYLPSPAVSNGFFIQKAAVTAFAQHALTDAFPTVAVLPNGNIGMAYEQDSNGGQGSGPNSTAAFAFTSNGGSSWTDYSGSTQGTQCAALGTPGCVFSGDGLNADSHWFPGYSGLVVNGSNTYYTVTVETNTGACVEALMSISTNSGTSWGTLINVDTTSACWVAPPIFIPGSGVSSLCPSGCIIAPVNENGQTKFLFSTNGGTTWGSPQTVPNIIFNQLEDFFWWNGNNQLIGIGRSAAAQPLRVFSTPDFGNTWTVTAYSNTVTNALAGLYSSAWQLTSPVVINPNQGDGKLTILFGDRGQGQINAINATPNILLTAANTIGQGQPLASFTAGNTEGYETACLVSGNTWLFAWYAPNGSSNGQIFTMQGTYVPSSVAISPALFARK